MGSNAGSTKWSLPHFAILLLLQMTAFAVYLDFHALRSNGHDILSASTHAIEQERPSISGRASPHLYTMLPSGWDSSGQAMYHKTKEQLAIANTGNPQSIHTHSVLPLAPVRTTGSYNYWFKDNFPGDSATKWEPATFQRFYRFLSSCRYYVGFGTWIGPTLFFAGQLVDEAFGIEADPVAYATVETNLALNREAEWARHVHLHAHAVGLGSNTSLVPSNVTMSSAGAGNSCSGLGKVACGEVSVRWNVNAYPLPALLQYWRVPSTRDLFIKVDVESFECQLVPSWLPWLKSLSSKKPVFHIAFHSQITNCSQEEYQDIFEFAKLFDFAESNCTDDVAKRWTCGEGEYLFFDNF